jgi:uncharacterized protein
VFFVTFVSFVVKAVVIQRSERQMKEVFADTSYYGAMLSARDVAHEAARRWSLAFTGVVVTTEFVLIELGNGVRGDTQRRGFAAFVSQLRMDPNTVVLPASSALFQAGMRLFESRADKDWSVTDCISFVVMEQRKLAEALTADHHFEQAGFTALLRQGA